jgi:hypothetical protein
LLGSSLDGPQPAASRRLRKIFMTPADPNEPDQTVPPPDRTPGGRAARRPAAAKRKPTRSKAKAAKTKAVKAKTAKTKAAKTKTGKARVEKVGPARLAHRKGPAPTVWELPPEPAPVVEVAPLLTTKPKGAGAVGRILLVGLVVVALAALGIATQVTSEPNTGTIKVHDGTDTDPVTRNEPHVEGDAFVEGFNMAAESGDLFFFSWPPTGNGELVLETTWAADDGEPAFHFLAGPFDLPCGHYRVGASNGPAEPADFPGGMKKKTFWVECPEEEPGPEPEPTTSTSPPSSSSSSSSSTGPGPEPEPEPEPELECPADLGAEAQADGSVLLTWTPAPGSDGTNVYRAVGDGDFEYVTTTAAGVGTYLDETTEAGGAYAYTVTALFGNEESVGCEAVEVTAIPDLPTVAGAGLALGGSLLAFALASRRKA